MKMTTWRMTVGLAALTVLAGGLLPFSTGCGLASGCPITDTGKDACSRGESECVDIDTIRACGTSGPCDAHWFSQKCESGEICTVVDSVAGCRPLG